MLHKHGRQLAMTVGKDFDQAVAKSLSPADPAKRIG